MTKDEIKIIVLSNVYCTIYDQFHLYKNDSLNFYNKEISTRVKHHIKNENNIHEINSYDITKYEFTTTELLNTSFKIYQPIHLSDTEDLLNQKKLMFITVLIDSITYTIEYDKIFLKYKERIEKAKKELEKEKRKIKKEKNYLEDLPIPTDKSYDINDQLMT